jgi:hypothetical protein
MSPSTLDIVLLPGLLFIFGAFVLIATFTSYSPGNPNVRARWVGIAILALAFLASLGPFWNLIKPGEGFIYRASIYSRKALYAHYVMPLLTLAALIGGIVYHRWMKRTREEEYIG